MPSARCTRHGPNTIGRRDCGNDGMSHPHTFTSRTSTSTFALLVPLRVTEREGELDTSITRLALFGSCLSPSLAITIVVSLGTPPSSRIVSPSSSETSDRPADLWTGSTGCGASWGACQKCIPVVSNSVVGRAWAAGLTSEASCATPLSIGLLAPSVAIARHSTAEQLARPPKTAVSATSAHATRGAGSASGPSGGGALGIRTPRRVIWGEA